MAACQDVELRSLRYGEARASFLWLGAEDIGKGAPKGKGKYRVHTTGKLCSI